MTTLFKLESCGVYECVFHLWNKRKVWAHVIHGKVSRRGSEWVHDIFADDFPVGTRIQVSHSIIVTKME